MDETDLVHSMGHVQHVSSVDPGIGGGGHDQAMKISIES